MCPSPTPGDALGLWHELRGLYAAAGEDARRAYMRGFAVVCGAAALVLLSTPLLGTSSGPFAPAIPVLAGLLVGVGSFVWRRAKFLGRREALRRAEEDLGEYAAITGRRARWPSPGGR